MEAMLTQKKALFRKSLSSSPGLYRVFMYRLNRAILPIAAMVKFVYLGLVLCMAMGTLFELKGIYHIDLIPGVDTAFDLYHDGIKKILYQLYN